MMSETLRLFFIPGFGETEFVFSNLTPGLPGQHIFVDVWSLLGEQPRPGLNVLDFAREVIDHFAITADDVIIGHSMGGWIAYHIKQHAGCRIVQLASWTEPDRVIAPTTNLHLVTLAVRTGLLFNRFNLNMALLVKYRNNPSGSIFNDTFSRLISKPTEAVLNELRLILVPVTPKTVAEPELRIHARKDTIIRYPRGAFHEVPGDHFALFTHPEAVLAPIRAWLEREGLTR